METFDMLNETVLFPYTDLPLDDFDIDDHAAFYLDATPEEDFEDGMDGDFNSAMASAGFGTDEDYGYYGEGDD